MSKNLLTLFDIWPVMNWIRRYDIKCGCL